MYIDIVLLMIVKLYICSFYCVVDENVDDMEVFLI